jgi:molecular chaperone HtpG
MLPVQKERSSRQRFTDPVIVGKDILELLSGAMYVEPLTIYREFVQNAADAIDEAEKQGLYKRSTQPRIDITLDLQNRTVKVRDNGAGIERNSVSRRLTSLGASKKRGKGTRGFRGVGRLAGLAYCQELVFRTKHVNDERVFEMVWDCRRLKELLRDHERDDDLSSILQEIVSVDSVSTKEYPHHFFEIELRQVVRHGSDLLLNEDAISRYLAQVGPVPFSPRFGFSMEIQQLLEQLNIGKSYDIYINGCNTPLVRPFQNDFVAKRGVKNSRATLETFQIPGISEGVDAVGWILHHDYVGALPDHLGIKGLRIRLGNIQIGDANTLQSVFPEPRFNSWAIGEVHILTPRLVPNGRRDDFEQNNHYANLLNHITPKAKAIAKACRNLSRERVLHRKQAASAPNGVNGKKIDWAKAKDFLAKHADKPLNKAHRINLQRLVQNGTTTYAELIRILVDSGATDQPPR